MVILIESASSARVPSISAEHFSSGAQFLNTTFVLLLPPVTLIFPVTKIHASE